MDVVIGSRRILSSAIVSVLGLTVSSVSIAASDVDINLDATTNMTSFTAGIYESNADGANLNIGTITSIWGSESAPYATISTGGTTGGDELGALLRCARPHCHHRPAREHPAQVA